MSKGAKPLPKGRRPRKAAPRARRFDPAGAITAWPEGRLHLVPGFHTAALHCGLKSKREKPDLGLLWAERPAAAAGVFTTNLFCAAPVTYSRAALAAGKGRARAVVVNAGNANACTGRPGERDARRMARAAARSVKCPVRQVLVCSTGVIGVPLPMEKIERGIGRLGSWVKGKRTRGDFARAILTTDRSPKTAAARVEIGGRKVRLAGVTKGSGMIGPHLATTLGFVATDAAIAPGALQKALSAVSVETYNCLTVDGDTSTNDTLLALASGRAGNPLLERASGAAYRAFRAALYQVCDDLARQIAADGEGATHTVTLFVGGAGSDAQARQAARTVANSPLVKTAIAGHDPNWGRIMAAAGRAGVPFDPAESSLTICGFELFRGGRPTAFDRPAVSRALKKRDVNIVLLLGHGPGRAKFYTCDFTHGYISINADYHT